MTNITKLNTTNFLMWSKQIHALLDGYDLAGYLDKSKPAPSYTVTIGGLVQPIPEHAKWKRQDSLIYSAILGAISINIQLLLSRTVTSIDVWNTLGATYGKPSHENISNNSSISSNTGPKETRLSKSMSKEIDGSDTM
ncbi:Retrovirus-related Pol polyprotein from transposon RE2 [Cardamine amara subsp. amara]|uniref:Retrovirus-related Pol polyprotein from transposon RE2 n=1 Tax=Cardamine amara subsp. amara TaxID=228776 RepID=A0ABD1BNU1_CARAN